jgi:peptidyl-prolyl cis-trans isomerase SurA
MRIVLPIRVKVLLLPIAVCAHTCLIVPTASPQSGSDSAAPVVVDRVVAQVNQRIILASDLDDEIRISVLEPDSATDGRLTRQQALEQIISRSLIEQQIRQEDTQAAEPSQSEIEARLVELRKELPACVHENCATDAGWNTFLAAHDLTLARVTAYLRYRLEILRFIEQRFRPGIRISQDEIAAYYNKTLVPQYKSGESIPSLEQVAPRIEEILLEQQVNVLFSNWLANLRQQGDVEILDPSLEMPSSPTSGGSGQ